MEPGPERGRGFSMRMIKLRATRWHPSRSEGDVYSVKPPQALVELHKRWAVKGRIEDHAVQASVEAEEVEEEVEKEVEKEPPKKRSYRRRDMQAE
jgi:hypothetical protein